MKTRAFFVILLLTANALFASENTFAGYRDSKTRIEFPPVLADMKFVGVHEYDKSELGYSVRYQGRNLIKADIYVYDGGLSYIPNGWENRFVKAESAAVGRALKIMQDRGKYSGVKHIYSGVVPRQGIIRFAWNKYQYSQVGQDNKTYTGLRFSESYISGFAGNLVKIRLTYKKEEAKEGTIIAERLIKDIVRLIKDAGTPKKGEKLSFTVVIDGSLPEQLGAPWLGYIMERQVYINEHKDQYDLMPGIIVPKFADEYAARMSLTQIWKELKEKDNTLNDRYLSALELVLNAGFMREYVYAYLRLPSWKKPAKLKLERFESWKKQNLKNHKAEFHGSIRLTITGE